MLPVRLLQSSIPQADVALEPKMDSATTTVCSLTVGIFGILFHSGFFLVGVGRRYMAIVRSDSASLSIPGG